MQNWKSPSFFLFFFALFSSLVSQVYGQLSCIPTWQYQDSPYWRASFVFTGLVDTFVADKKLVSPNGYHVSDTYTPVFNLVRFTVEKKFRGDIGEKIEIVSAFNFKEGERYFVYAVPGNDGKIYQLDDGMCGKPPILLTDAKDDTEYAEEIASGKIGTRIFGSVLEAHWRLGESPKSLFLANVEVTIRSKKYSFTTKTDESGKFLFKNIPPAEYKIAASTPEGLHEIILKDPNLHSQNSPPNTVVVGKSTLSELFPLGPGQKPKNSYRHWASHNFVFTSLSSIEGKVVGLDGGIPPQQFLWLFSIGVNGKLRFDDPIQYLRTDTSTGKFIFTDIPAGKYRILINRYNCHSDTNPQYGRSFFPGVRDETESGAISVGENERLSLKDFQLLPQLKERQFSGVVLTADKKPLANATIFAGNKNYLTPNECVIHLETKTDEFGRFQLKGYEGYEYKIRAYIQPAEQNSSRLFSKMLELPAKGDVEDIELIVDSLN